MTEESKIMLLDEEGNEFQFHVIDVIEVDGSEYAILLPVDTEQDEAEVLRIEVDENGEETLVQINDEEEWERVAQVWEELVTAEEEGEEEE